jgi:hypothetical protein
VEERQVKHPRCLSNTVGQRPLTNRFTWKLLVAAGTAAPSLG